MIYSSEYLRYLASPEWQAKRQTLFVKGGKARCYCCNRARRNLEVHHLTYANLGNEQPGDLVLVCPNCHDIIHRHAAHFVPTIRLATEAVKAWRKTRQGLKGFRGVIRKRKYPLRDYG